MVGITSRQRREGRLFGLFFETGRGTFSAASGMRKVLTDIKVAMKHPGSISPTIAPSCVHKALRETNTPEHTAAFLN